MTSPRSSVVGRTDLEGYRHVVVPLDGSELAAAALPTARALAARLGADVHAVSIAGTQEEAGELRTQAARALGVEPLDARVHVTVGVPAAGIERCAADLAGSLLCMSTHGHGRAVSAIVGSVARSLVASRTQPVFLVGPALAHDLAYSDDRAAPLSTGPIVACVDGSEDSERVLPVAAAWAKGLGIPLLVVTVAEPTPPPIRPGATWGRRHGPDGDADAYVAGLAQAWSAAAGEARGEVIYDPISAADGLRAHLDAHPAAMLVVTTHHGRERDRVEFGGNAAAIVHAVPAPVLVVPVGR